MIVYICNYHAKSTAVNKHHDRLLAVNSLCEHHDKSTALEHHHQHLALNSIYNLIIQFTPSIQIKVWLNVTSELDKSHAFETHALTSETRPLKQSEDQITNRTFYSDTFYTVALLLI